MQPSPFSSARRWRAVWALVLLALCADPASLAAQFSRETPVVLAARNVGPAVVNINTEEVLERSPFSSLPEFFPPEFERFFRGFGSPQQQRRRSLGSGVIIDPKGFVLTNEHVIRRATRIQVALIDKREFEAEVIGADSRSDLAVIRIHAREPLPYVRMGTSEDLMPGETVIAIGNPFGLGHTVTTGVISGIHRAVALAGGVRSDFIQIDAAINPGNSGGPLLNINGELIGVNTAIRAQAEGIGFAVPIDRVRRIVNDLVQFGEIQHGWIGLVVQDLTGPIRRQFSYPDAQGAFIRRVIQNGPAEASGVRPGMILMRIGSKPVESRIDYLSELSGYTQGSEMVLQLFWEGEVIERRVVAQAMTAEAADLMAQDRLGIIARDLTAPVRQRYQIPVRDGVVIVQVLQGSPAARVGLQPGDVIRRMNNLQIRGFQDFQKAMATGQYERDVVLLVQRGRYRAFVTLQARG
ncbi:MAG: trypsin-like peptidase domain-containing protein [Candidatus Tectomicrobia bacterium]|nr:trypsin-like peptidase domain-containing protein [Candidatus Tectomicrobia bacterium]